jgi:hypothetical protein
MATHIVSVTEEFVTAPDVGALPTELCIKGKLFGSSQGSKVVHIAGAKLDHTAIGDWSTTEIWFPVYGGSPTIPTLKRGKHYKIWLEDGFGHLISNKYDYLHTIKWKQVTPESGFPGNKVKLESFENYPFFGKKKSRKVLFGIKEATILSWNSMDIEVKVPDTSFPVWMMGMKVKVTITDHGECISTKQDFMIKNPDAYKSP